MVEQLINLFQAYLAGWSWEEWQASGSSDKEEIVVNAMADLGPSMKIDVEEAYDIFYDWVAGLTEADFDSELTEANNIVQRFANSSSYSGYASGLSNISTRVAPGPSAAKTKEDIKLRDKCLAAAQKAIATGPEAVELYNRGYWGKRYVATKDFCPAIDPETLELVYDPDKKNHIYQQANSAYFKRQDEYRTNYAAQRKLNNQ